MQKELTEIRRNIETCLQRCLPPATRRPRVLHRAMRYAVFPGGKRLRPVVMLLTARMIGTDPRRVLPAACGTELIHSFSLVHDDLPGMDNDDVRRGKPSCHRKYGEGMAILAGDALLTLGFRMIARTGSLELVREMADAIGSSGMAGGQALDILHQGKHLSGTGKRLMDAMKTGRLFLFCFRAPALLVRVPQSALTALDCLGRDFGQAFQVRDDIEDREGDPAALRKHLGMLQRRMRRSLSVFGSDAAPLAGVIEEVFGELA